MSPIKIIASTFSIIITTSTLLLSQDFDNVYFNSEWIVTTIDKAFYYRQSGFNPQIPSYDGKVTDYYLDNGHIEMTGQYENGLKSGVFSFYYPNGELKMAVNYKENERIGSWKEFYHNGVLKLDIEYEQDLEKIIELNDSLGNSLIEKNKLKYNLVYRDTPDGFGGVYSQRDVVTYEISGKLFQNLRDGKWIVKKGNETYANMTYIQGKMKQGFFYSKGQKTTLLNNIAFPLITDPIKFFVTENFTLEQGAKIYNNYVLQGLQEYKYKSMNKVSIKSYEDLMQYLNDHFELRSDKLEQIEILLETNNGKITNFMTKPKISKLAENDLRLIFETIEQIEFDRNQTITIKFKIKPDESFETN